MTSAYISAEVLCQYIYIYIFFAFSDINQPIAVHSYLTRRERLNIEISLLKTDDILINKIRFFK